MSNVRERFIAVGGRMIHRSWASNPSSEYLAIIDGDTKAIAYEMEPTPEEAMKAALAKYDAAMKVPA